MLSDSKGRLWVGTVYGVCRYTDQDCFERVKSETELLYTHQILENHDGRALFNMGTEIGMYEPEKNKIVTAISGMADRDMHVLKCFIDGDNNLWVINPLRIRCYNSTTFELKHDFDREEAYTHYAFLRDNGELWLASQNTLSILDTRSGEYMDVPNGIRRHPELSGALIYYIHQSNPSQFIINTNEGIFMYGTANDKAIHQDDSGLPFNAPRAKITAMFTDSQKNLRVGSFDQGFTVHYNSMERQNALFRYSSKT